MLERENLLSLIVAQDIAVPVNLPIQQEDDLSFAMKLFNDSGYEILPVVDPATGRLLGDILRSDVIEAYNRELSLRDSLSNAAESFDVAERLGRVDLGDGFALVEYEVPSHLIGKSLLELDLRRRVGVQAVLVKRGARRLVPGPDTILVVGDVILFAGGAADLDERLKRL
jgi:Trk K+ transport system NAD-binding subunit